MMDDKDVNAFKGDEQETSTEFNLARGQQQLERGLQSRHIQFLALGTFCLPIHTSRLTNSRWSNWNWSLRRVRKHPV